MQKAGELGDKYTFDLKTVNVPEHQDVVASYAALVLEAKLVTCLVDKNLTPEARKKTLESLSGQVGSWSAKYDRDFKSLVLKELLTEAMNRVVSRPPKA